MAAKKHEPKKKVAEKKTETKKPKLEAILIAKTPKKKK